ncbi:MAG: hypothetical protein ABR538_03150, partial [Candidatus Binatia bacterium]
MKRRFTDLALAAVVLGVVQALVGSAALAWLYRDLLLAPYRFFPAHSYDAFAKVWFALAERLPLPVLLENFLGQGLAAKLALAPELVAINVAVAIVLALVLAPVAGLVGVGRVDRGGRALVLLVIVALAIHVAAWAAAFQAPETVTATRLLRAVLRDLRQGGAGLALLVLVMSAVLSRVLLSRRGGAGAAVAAGV